MTELSKEEKEKLEAEKKAAEEKELAEKKAEENAAKNVFKEDSWMYHKVHEPKLFKKGASIPEEWSSENTFGWFKDITNNFHWRKK